MSRIQIMSEQRVERTLNRLAYEIIERNRGASNLEIAGIRERGTALARILAEKIGAIEGRRFDVNMLDVERFRDDRTWDPTASQPVVLSVDVTDKDVILVDDVLFTGRTARAALDAVVRCGRPRTIQFAVLIDRGHREYPIEPSYIGRRIQTKHKERVVVEVNGGISAYVVEEEE